MTKKLLDEIEENELKEPEQDSLWEVAGRESGKPRLGIEKIHPSLQPPESEDFGLPPNLPARLDPPSAREPVPDLNPPASWRNSSESQTIVGPGSSDTFRRKVKGLSELNPPEPRRLDEHGYVEGRYASKNPIVGKSPEQKLNDAFEKFDRQIQSGSRTLSSSLSDLACE